MNDINPEPPDLPTFGYNSLRARVKPEWAMTGFQQARGMGLWHGDPATYKTFTVLDNMLHMATGAKHWNGFWIPRKRKVLYVLAEGVDFFAERMESWLILHDHINRDRIEEDFRIYPDAVDLKNPRDVRRVILTAQKWGAEVVVFDTLARMLGGENENDGAVANAIIRNLEHVKKEINGFSWLVHHNSKEGKVRGASQFSGAMDIIVETVKGTDEDVILKCKKMKNGREFNDIHLVMRQFGPSVAPVSTLNSGNLYNGEAPSLDKPFDFSEAF